jgi:O-acetyl-ADP-ribose deacetylase (regulator of RNase III)
MTYQEIRGNIFNSNAVSLVNTVNCVGVMGKGIALEFKRRFPKMFHEYENNCKLGNLKPGNIYFYKDNNLLILNFAIKDHWKFPSRIEWIESCLIQFIKIYKSKNIISVAFPWMGALNGGIPINKIKAIMRKYLVGLPDIDIEIYDFDPSVPDPLYNKLVATVKTLDAETFSRISKLQKGACIKIISAIISGEIKSLPQLANSKIIGKASIDNLYNFLVDTKNNKKPINKKLFE